MPLARRSLVLLRFVVKYVEPECPTERSRVGLVSCRSLMPCQYQTMLPGYGN